MRRTGRALAVAVVPTVSLAVVMIPGVARADDFRGDTRVSGHGQVITGTGPNAVINSISIRDVEGGLYRASGTVQITTGNARAVGEAYCVTGSTASPGFDAAAIGLHILRSDLPALERNSDVLLFVTRPRGAGVGAVGSDPAAGASCPRDNFVLPGSVGLQPLTSGHISIEIPDQDWTDRAGNYDNGYDNGYRSRSTRGR